MLTKGGCPKTMRSIKDALEAIEGKWRLLILFSLTGGPKRFKQISKEVSGITDTMLSKELKNLELNNLIRRDVYDSFPPTVEYTITPHGNSLERVPGELHYLGLAHRKKSWESRTERSMHVYNPLAHGGQGKGDHEG